MDMILKNAILFIYISSLVEVNQAIKALVTDWSIEGQSLGLWQKHCACKGPITIVCCRGGWKIIFMSSRFNNDAQSRYSPSRVNV